MNIPVTVGDVIGFMKQMDKDLKEQDPSKELGWPWMPEQAEPAPVTAGEWTPEQIDAMALCCAVKGLILLRNILQNTVKELREQLDAEREEVTKWHDAFEKTVAERDATKLQLAAERKKVKQILEQLDTSDYEVSQLRNELDAAHKQLVKIREEK